MRKSIIVFAALSLAVAVAFSQTTLTFTGTKEQGRYLRLDSVKVTNISRSWSETVVYPDTVLVFANSGLALAEASQLRLSAYPNPGAGRTTIAVESPSDEIAVATVTNLAGQVVYRRDVSLSTGRNILELKLGRQQVCLLSVATSQGVRTIKILNTGADNDFELKNVASSPVVDKRTTNASFSSGDSLRIVGYAKNNGVSICSYPLYVTSTASSTHTLVFATDAVFSVSATSKVLFSPGNLQWSAKNGGSTATTHTVAGGGTAPGTWRFALHQYDTIGIGNNNASSTYSGWIDLFGWATSGWDNTSVYSWSTAFNPWDTTTNTSVMYGPYNSSRDPIDITGANANYDWGVYNAIKNPKTNTIDPPGTWRVPTAREWGYLLKADGTGVFRQTGSGMLYAHANVVGVNGIIVLPDNWSPATYTFTNVNGNTNMGVDFSDNVINAADWAVLENAGCVFLPAAGYRYGRIAAVGSLGRYWSSTAHTNYGTAYDMEIHSYYVSVEILGSYGGHTACMGESVRLVKDY